MKSFLVVASLLIGFNAYAYKAEVLNNWFTLGSTKGVDNNGNTCDVIMITALKMNIINLKMANLELHKTPRFNSYMNNQLVEIKESSTSLFVVVKSTPTNSYTPAMKQTLSIKKASNGTAVTVIEEEMRFFGKIQKATCTIN